MQQTRKKTNTTNEDDNANFHGALCLYVNMYMDAISHH